MATSRPTRPAASQANWSGSRSQNLTTQTYPRFASLSAPYQKTSGPVPSYLIQLKAHNFHSWLKHTRNFPDLSLVSKHNPHSWCQCSHSGASHSNHHQIITTRCQSYLYKPKQSFRSHSKEHFSFMHSRENNWKRAVVQNSDRSRNLNKTLTLLSNFILLSILSFLLLFHHHHQSAAGDPMLCCQPALPQHLGNPQINSMSPPCDPKPTEYVPYIMFQGAQLPRRAHSWVEAGTVLSAGDSQQQAEN